MNTVTPHSATKLNSYKTTLYICRKTTTTCPMELLALTVSDDCTAKILDDSTGAFKQILFGWRLLGAVYFHLSSWGSILFLLLFQFLFLVRSCSNFWFCFSFYFVSMSISVSISIPVSVSIMFLFQFPFLFLFRFCFDFCFFVVPVSVGVSVSLLFLFLFKQLP